MLCRKIRVFRLMVALKHGPELIIVHSLGNQHHQRWTMMRLEVCLYRISNSVLKRASEPHHTNLAGSRAAPGAE